MDRNILPVIPLQLRFTHPLEDCKRWHFLCVMARLHGSLAT